MKVTIWGSRGSIPAPGKDTVIYGGESTCIEIVTDSGERIVIDAGSGIRKLGNKLVGDHGAKVFTLLLTHAHWDHLSGFPFFKPAYRPDRSIRLCGGADPQASLMKYLRHQMDPPYFPVDMSEMKAAFSEGCSCGFSDCGNALPGIGKAFRCESIPLSHPNGGYGFKHTDTSGRSFVFLTDNELRFRHESGRSRDDYVAFCAGAELLFHDAHYTDEEYARTRTWGHSTYKDAVDLALDAGVRRLGLFHHDPDRTDAQIDANVAWCRDYLRSRGSDIDCFACAAGMEFDL